MPRAARVKLEDGIYHVMIRSISELKLFGDSSDKDKYLSLIKRYQNTFLFKIYSYCFMTNHAHFIIDCNGADISKFMHCINQSYAIYFNKKHDRVGHVFADRFKSKPITNNQQLLITSAYIHNNAKDISGFESSVETYLYSSLGIFLGIHRDIFNLVDPAFILSLYNTTPSKAKFRYIQFVKSRTHEEIPKNIEFEDENTEYRSERKILIRNYSPKDIIDFVSRYTDSDFSVHIKFNRQNHRNKAVCVLLMRSLCGFSYKEICAIFGNQCSSNIGRLCSLGSEIINTKYSGLIPTLISQNTKIST